MWYNYLQRCKALFIATTAFIWK